MLKCLVTGCDLYLCDDLRYHYHGDLHKIGGVYVFNGVIHKNVPVATGGKQAETREELMASERAILIAHQSDMWERRGIFILAQVEMNATARGRSRTDQDIDGYGVVTGSEIIGPIYDLRDLNAVVEEHTDGKALCLTSPIVWSAERHLILPSYL